VGCPAGKYGGSSGCVDCLAGSYAAAGATSCTVCGEYFPLYPLLFPLLFCLFDTRCY
jgi:hypothetical protein